MATPKAPLGTRHGQCARGVSPGARERQERNQRTGWQSCPIPSPFRPTLMWDLVWITPGILSSFCHLL